MHVLIVFLLCILCCGASLTANETEILAVAAVQASPSMTALKTELFQLISKTNTIRSVPGIFSQQDGVYPSEGELQLPLFGAKIPWPDVMQELTADSNRVLLIMIRHGEAWENVNPLSNDHCEFLFEGHVINNFDSDLDPAGIRQAQDLNSLLRSDAPYAANGTRSWFDALELSNKPFLSSPLTRTLQTSKYALDGLPVSRVVGTEIVRASIGHDVCNFRRSVQTLTSFNDLPYPFSTSCKLPDDSLVDIYVKNSVQTGLQFEFPIRPAGGSGFGILSDADMLWRSDVEDDTHEARAAAFLTQLFEYKDFYTYTDGVFSLPVVGLVSHGETVDAIYKASGESGYSPRNTQVVPLMLQLS